MATKKRRIAHHIVSGVLIAIALLYAIFRFDFVFLRTVRAFVDLGTSLAYYFLFPFELEYLIPTTITEIPSGMDAFPVVSVETVKRVFENFGELFFNFDNLQAYLDDVGVVVGDIAEILSQLLLPLLCVALVLYFGYAKIDDPKARKKKLAEKVKKRAGKLAKKNAKRAKKGLPPKQPKVQEPLTPEERRAQAKRKKIEYPDSKPLAWWKRNAEGRFFSPICREIKRYFHFLNGHFWYKFALANLWLYNLNILTIGITAFAWVFYASISIDYGNIFVQIAKLFMDISVAWDFLAIEIWLIIGYLIFNTIRRRHGDKRLLKYIAKDEQFLEKHPGALFVVGKQRSKKTSILTTLKLVTERRFRKKAQEKFAQRDKQFPFFHWSVIEKVVKNGRKKGKFKTFEDMTFFAFLVKKCYNEKRENLKKYLRRRIKEYYGYDMELLFAYSKRHAMTYNNGAIEISLFEAIERYAQLFFIYSQRSPLDISNYSIREDFTFKDYGYYPIFDGNPLRSPKESAEYSQYSHIMDFDAFRPGKVFDEKTRYDTAIEYGIGVLQEFAKERKNRYTQGGQKASDFEANQNNDFFELDTKMRGHIATIDFFDFWLWLFDDQRAGDLGATLADLATHCLIKETSPAKTVLPFFAIEELIYHGWTKLHDKVQYFIRNRKGKNTLLVHLFNRLYILYFRHCDRVFNRYGVHTARIKTTDGADKEILGEAEKLYIPVAFTYNERFATDSARIFYRVKHRKAKRTLDAVEQYKTIYPTQRDYRKHKSYYVEDMNYAYGDKLKRGKQ